MILNRTKNLQSITLPKLTKEEKGPSKIKFQSHGNRMIIMSYSIKDPDSIAKSEYEDEKDDDDDDDEDENNNDDSDTDSDIPDIPEKYRYYNYKFCAHPTDPQTKYLVNKITILKNKLKKEQC